MILPNSNNNKNIAQKIRRVSDVPELNTLLDPLYSKTIVIHHTETFDHSLLYFMVSGNTLL